MRKLFAVAVILTLLATLGFVLTPPALVDHGTMPGLPGDLDAYLAATEQSAASAFALIPGTEKRIRWHSDTVRTACSVVYLHGFSATRQEIAPVAERVATALGANLFETRLTGHGRAWGAMVDVSAEDWLEDAAEAIAIGKRLGERVIVIGTSTGATLALAMAGHPAFDSIDALVFISPNFAPSDAAARWITKPGGPLLLRSTVGDTRSWQAHNAQQERFWSTRYPSAVLVEVMRLVDLANSKLPLDIEQPLLTLLSPNDSVVSPQAVYESLERIAAPRKHLVEFDDVGDPSNHVLAGDILSPENSDQVAREIVEFVGCDSSAE